MTSTDTKEQSIARPSDTLDSSAIVHFESAMKGNKAFQISDTADHEDLYWRKVQEEKYMFYSK